MSKKPPWTCPKCLQKFINCIGRDFIDGHLILAKRRDHRTFHRIELDTIHHFKIHRPEDLDDEFMGLLREAYAVGMQERP